jgi:hypothetical protein
MAGYSRRGKTKQKSRTAAVIFITKLDQAASFNIGTNKPAGGAAPLEEFFDPIRRRMLAVLGPASLIRAVAAPALLRLMD